MWAWLKNYPKSLVSELVVIMSIASKLHKLFLSVNLSLGHSIYTSIYPHYPYYSTLPYFPRYCVSKSTECKNTLCSLSRRTLMNHLVELALPIPSRTRNNVYWFNLNESHEDRDKFVARAEPGWSWIAWATLPVAPSLSYAILPHGIFLPLPLWLSFPRLNFFMVVDCSLKSKLCCGWWWRKRRSIGHKFTQLCKQTEAACTQRDAKKIACILCTSPLSLAYFRLFHPTNSPHKNLWNIMQ